MSSVLSLENCVLNDKIKMRINPIMICTLSLAMMCQLGKRKRNPDVRLHVPLSMCRSGPGGPEMGSVLHRGASCVVKRKMLDGERTLPS